MQNGHLKPTLRRKRKALSELDGLLEVTAVCYRYRKISSYAFRKPCNGKFLRRKGSVFFTKSRMVRWWCVMSLRPRACRLLYRSVCYLRMMLTIHSYLPGCRTSTILWPVPHCTCLARVTEAHDFEWLVSSCYNGFLSNCDLMIACPLSHYAVLFKEVKSNSSM